MRPTLLDIFGYKFHAYPTMLAIAFLTCTLLVVRDLQRHDPPIDASPQGGLWVFLGALFGAKAYWILQYSEPKYLWHTLYIWEGGLVFYGGLMGGVVAILAYLKFNKLPIWPAADICAPYLALGEAITRIGCFLNGCCWGGITSLPWAVTFPRHSHVFDQQLADHQLAASASAAAPVHPTQLYMTLGLLGAMIIMKRYLKRPHADGMIVLLYCMSYGVLRFTVEALRADSARSFLGMTISQAISLAMALAGTVLLIAWVRFKPPFSSAPSEPKDPDGSGTNGSVD